MGREIRRTITEPEAVRVLTHPVRLELLTYLISNSPATASACARAVGDTPSNCSYHLRALARAGLVAPDGSADGRERPWRALVTGFDSEDPALIGLSVQRGQRLLREHLARRDTLPHEWREASAHGTYTVRVTAQELAALNAAVDAVIRPYLAPTRDDPPADAVDVHVGYLAFPL